MHNNCLWDSALAGHALWKHHMEFGAGICSFCSSYICQVKRWRQFADWHIKAAVVFRLMAQSLLSGKYLRLKRLKQSNSYFLGNCQFLRHWKLFSSTLEFQSRNETTVTEHNHQAAPLTCFLSCIALEVWLGLSNNVHSLQLGNGWSLQTTKHYFII